MTKVAVSLKNTESYLVTPHPLNHMISRSHRLAALDSPWMFNSSLQFLRRKLNAHCVWGQSIIPRLCHVFTHSASSVLTNMQILQEDSYKRQSNVRFVRHLFKSPKATRSRTCPHLIISTDWWMFSLLKMAAHRPRNAAAVMKTIQLSLTVSSAKYSSALLVLKLISGWRPQEVITMLW